MKTIFHAQSVVKSLKVKAIYQPTRKHIVFYRLMSIGIVYVDSSFNVSKLLQFEKYSQDICGNKFKGRGEMTVHIKKRHLYKIRYPCEICPPGKSWRTLFQLQRHVKVFHHNIREFKCEWKVFDEITLKNNSVKFSLF